MTVQLLVSEPARFEGTTVIGAPQVDAAVVVPGDGSWGDAIPVKGRMEKRTFFQIITDVSIEVAICYGGQSPDAVTPRRLELPNAGFMYDDGLLSSDNDSVTRNVVWNFYFRVIL